AYVLQTLAEAARYDYAPIRVCIDGREMRATGVVVCKGRLYGGPFLLAPDASVGAPGFSVALFGAGGALDALRYAAALPFDMLPKLPGVSLVRGRVIQIDADRRIPVQADGDAAGTIP